MEKKLQKAINTRCPLLISLKPLATQKHFFTFSLFLSLTTPRENQQLPKKRGMHKERVKGHVKELRLGAKQ